MLSACLNNQSCCSCHAHSQSWDKGHTQSTGLARFTHPHLTAQVQWPALKELWTLNTSEQHSSHTAASGTRQVSQQCTARQPRVCTTHTHTTRRACAPPSRAAGPCPLTCCLSQVLPGTRAVTHCGCTCSTSQALQSSFLHMRTDMYLTSSNKSRVPAAPQRPTVPHHTQAHLLQPYRHMNQPTTTTAAAAAVLPSI